MKVDVLCGDALPVLRTLPDASVHCCVTSPPYFGLRVYSQGDVDPQEIGTEETPGAYVERVAAVFAEVRRILRHDGTLWIVIGDCYAARPNTGHGWDSSRLTLPQGRERRIQIAQAASMRKHRKFDRPHKSLLGIPWRLAFALQDQGWIWRADIVWHKPNGMCEPARDRPVGTHEYVLLFSGSERYHYATPPGGRRSVWPVATQKNPCRHPGAFPEALAERCILAGCPEGGTVLDPFGGSGTVGVVAERTGRNAVLIELSADYCAMARRRIGREQAQTKLPLHELGGAR